MSQYPITIQNNTDSPLNIGLLDASTPGEPIKIISTSGSYYVDVPYSATYAIGDSFGALITGTTYTTTLTSVCTPSQVAVLLTNLGQGYWTSETVGSNTRFTYLPTADTSVLSSLTYTAVISGYGWTTLNPSVSVTNIQVVSATKVFGINNTPEIVKSTNSGVSFTPVSSFGYTPCAGLSMISETEGVALFYDNVITNQVAICSTLDGVTWSLIQTIPYSGGVLSQVPTNAINIKDASNGIIALGDPSFFETKVYYSSTPLLGGYVALTNTIGEVLSGIIDLKSISSTESFVLFFNKGYKTIDGGTTWSAAISGTSFLGVSFFGNIGFVVDQTAGTVSTSSDNGNSWLQVYSFIDRKPQCVSFVTPLIGWIASEKILDGTLIISKTIDGGLSWIDQTTDTTAPLIANCLQMFDANNGYGVTSSTLLNTTTGGV